MKKACILLLTMLGLATAVCLGQSAPTNQPSSPHIKPPTASRTPSPSPPSGNASANSLEETLIAREKEVWEAIKKKDLQSFASFMAEDQLYISEVGVRSKAESVKELGEAPTMPDAKLDDWKVLMIDKDAAIVTYRATVTPPACGPATAATVMHLSTVWAKRGGKWLVLLHQDTTASGK
jgi:uncharacterized protein (TIGR02246 family)